MPGVIAPTMPLLSVIVEIGFMSFLGQYIEKAR